MKKLHISKKFDSIDVESVAYAEIHGLDVSKPISQAIINKTTEVTNNLLSFSCEQDLIENQVLKGYRDKIAILGRSQKKFPPSAESLINIIKRNQLFPSINTVVDIYNLSALETFLAFGVHDLDKIDGDIYFRFANEGETFTPIGGKEKIVAKGDYVYADNSKILAWLDSKDSDLVKICEETKNIILIVQGNSLTSLEYRLNALQTACERIVSCCGGEFNISSAKRTED